MSEMTLAEHKAQVDAKHSGMREQQLAKREENRPRKDHWLLVGPNGEIDGVCTKRFTKSAAAAFEEFFPKKKERHAASAEGWHIESDDENGSRWAAECARHQEAQA
ncbi:hypothetical protein L1080_003160 [Rhodococcus sp. MSC1_016]|jgi:hypothetical protein|uniref:hypothetical protein n=1 Tax=Rhodococcus sp. MSC1_016 TaxID=2909266 RepID=UPI00202EC64F|nr:hypothetical protein [Rhodococcus sp. MSC1_016]